ncbi:hypothetical protein AcW2_001285 [Taiwanofungus camphoratus]|nr:hypothetical protein AcW2_001285 [Antrodia cinnamomea]
MAAKPGGSIRGVTHQSVLDTFSALQLAEAMLKKLERSELEANSALSLEKIECILVSSNLVVRWLRNSLCSVNRLPPEILGIIFQYAKAPVFDGHPSFYEDFYPQFSVWEPAMKNPVDITVTHVCRRWRDVALGMPSFWTSIDDKHTKAQPNLLQRSRISPLKLLLKGTSSPFMEDVFRTEGSRIRELHWFETGDDLVLPHLEFAAPKLELFTLDIDGFTEHEPSFAPTLFKGHTPCLRQLALQNAVWLPSNRFSQLTHLFLSELLVPVTDLFEMLLGCPMLVDLILIDFEDSKHADIKPASESRKIALQSLRRLVLGADLEPDFHIMSSFLPCVTLNTDTAVRVFGQLEWTSSPSDLFRPLASLPAVENVTKICLSGHGFSMVAAAVGRSSGLRLDMDCDTLTQILPSILPISHVKEAWILATSNEKAAWCSAETLRKFFRTAMALEVLVVCSNHLRILADALMPSTPSERLCPRLSQLRVLFVGRNQVSSSIALLSKLQGQLGIWRLSVEYLPQYKGKRVARSSQDTHFEVVEYKDLEEEPRMAMPDICTTAAHRYWPSWA